MTYEQTKVQGQKYQLHDRLSWRKFQKSLRYGGKRGVGRWSSINLKTRDEDGTEQAWRAWVAGIGKVVVSFQATDHLVWEFWGKIVPKDSPVEDVLITDSNSAISDFRVEHYRFDDGRGSLMIEVSQPKLAAAA